MKKIIISLIIITSILFCWYLSFWKNEFKGKNQISNENEIIKTIEKHLLLWGEKIKIFVYEEWYSIKTPNTYTQSSKQYEFTWETNTFTWVFFIELWLKNFKWKISYIHIRWENWELLNTCDKNDLIKYIQYRNFIGKDIFETTWELNKNYLITDKEYIPITDQRWNQCMFINDWLNKHKKIYFN